MTTIRTFSSLKDALLIQKEYKTNYPFYSSQFIVLKQKDKFTVNFNGDREEFLSLIVWTDLVGVLSPLSEAA